LFDYLILLLSFERAVGIEAQSYTCVLKVLGANHTRVTAILTEGFRGISQSLQPNAETDPRSDHDRLLTNSFQHVINQLYHSNFDTGNVEK
jgi:hypothetical protein